MSSIRLTGLATGIDTEQMIKELMKAERTKVDRVQQDKQILQWRQELYNSINKDFANFILNTKKDFLGTTSTGAINLSPDRLSWVKGAVSSDESAVKVSTTSAAVNGTYLLNVRQLADSAKAASSQGITIEKEVDGKMVKDLSSIREQFQLSEGEVKFTIKTNVGEKSFNYTDIGEVNLNTIIKDINNSDLGVKVSYDSTIDRLFMQTTKTGEENWFSIEDQSTITKTIGGASQPVKFFTGDNSLLKLNLKDGEINKGIDALVDFNGASDIKMSSNQFTINGISIDLKKANPGNSVTITVDTDTDAVYDKIKSFVDKYNELVDKMGKLLGEKQYRDFRPLSAEQKESMKEKEIELWEEKAKSGLLRNDSIISKTMQSLRGSLYNEVEGAEGAFKVLYEIGITTERWAAGTVGGKLEINEDKLKKAISDDVNGVLELLFKEAGEVTVKGQDGNDVTKPGKGGVITRMYDTMIEGMKDIVGKAGPGEESNLFRSINSRIMLDFVTKHGSISLLDKDLRNIDRRINDLNAMLLDKEDKYYRQFSTMEKFVQQMNNQGNWFMQQLGM